MLRTLAALFGFLSVAAAQVGTGPTNPHLIGRYNDEKEFYFIETSGRSAEVTFLAALMTCRQAFGPLGTLATLETKEQFEFLNSKMIDNSTIPTLHQASRYWIGGNAIWTEGSRSPGTYKFQWVWGFSWNYVEARLADDPKAYDGWALGEPKQKDRTQPAAQPTTCMEYTFLPEASGFQFASNSCKEFRKFICQVDLSACATK